MNDVTIAPVSVSTEAREKMKRPARRRRKKWPYILGVVAVAGFGLFAFQKAHAKPTVTDPSLLVTVTKKTLAVEIFETGHVAPREKSDIKSKIAGQVLNVLVHEGDKVKKGDVLLELDPIDYQRDLARAEADVAQASTGLDFAKITKARAERGTAQGIAPQSELDSTAHDELQKNAALHAAEVSRTIAQDHIRYTKVLSPIDGTVIVRGIEAGESVVPGVQATMDGKPLLTIADLSALLVKVNMNQIDVAKVSVGRTATLTLDALPGHSYEAHITKVAPASVKLTGKEQEVFPVEALLEKPDGLVKPGMTADVRVHLDAKPDVLVVPLEAIVKDSGRSYVTKVSTVKGIEKSERVEVTVGMRNDREAEITSGVEAGAKVMLKPPVADGEMKM